MLAERSFRFGAVALLLTVGTGCAGARTTVVADGSQYPISLSRAVRDVDGRIVAQERASKVGALHHTSTAWGVLYSAVKLTPRTDISGAVNDQVAAVGGDAVVNLRVKGTHCASDFFVAFTAIPFWPGCANFVIEGDIIKVLPASPAQARRSSAPAGVRIAGMEAVR